MVDITNIIEIRAIEKSFGKNIVLHDVTLSIKGGSVLALMGANGAGKSTLVKILSGVYCADGGEILINGQRVDVSTPQLAREAGIITVHQIINDGVVQDLNIAENLLLDKLCDGSFGTYISQKQLELQAKPLADKIGLTLPLDTQVSELSQADKQLVAIARAISDKPKLLILDEPTSSLSDTESIKLFEAVNTMRSQGVAVVYISHRMSDIRSLADSIAALREGRIVGYFEPPLNYDEAVDSMLGHAVGAVTHQYQIGGAEILELDNVQLVPEAQPFNLTFHSDEVVVLTGLLSSGCTSLIEGIFGMNAFSSGQVKLNGDPWKPINPTQAIESGIFMVQEDRGNNALIPDFSIEKNVSLPFLKQFSSFGFINRKKERKHVEEAIRTTKVKYTDQDELMTTLSGGNQQKAMVARWMMDKCHVLLLNEPFQGVDISSRRQIGKLLRATSTNRATIVVCTDVEEALEIADRIIVFNQSNLMGDHQIDQIHMPTLINQIAAASPVKQENIITTEDVTNEKYA
ncbi:sugar ABC transporter ATP-binding protein [Vibrio sp. TH_r3]|uniref:sugar ABC transporter ATP-binding protein n=1 Tax=Vibrio sp. TH_r3 TaxID=3082084 RepID=UPI002954E6E1|nr:sugar ABC transporter ATP-binding protein [Vibrio sp. TH_r3]MDV7105355.1 sugar ABC transporter ATP-binding protein [Vibrio sp. TH_r3]